MDTKKYQIAVIDDEESITKLLKMILEEGFDCSVECFNDPTQALERLKEKEFDAISMDHRMPKLTGMDVVKILRNTEGPNLSTRILLLTGFREEAECLHPELLDQVYFLDKPVSNKRYLNWMNMLLKGKSESPR
jgi:CheY-like chemotaxis protein